MACLKFGNCMNASWTAQSAPWFVIEFTVPAQFQHALPHVHLSHGVHLVQLATARVPKGRNNL